jgi:hypothetical protein
LSDLNEIGERDGWRCWLCDKPVDPDASVNSDLGPSADSFALAKLKKGASGGERLAHRMCNTMKGKHAPVVAWPEDLLAAEPAPIVETVERLTRKGGRELVARFSSEADAEPMPKPAGLTETWNLRGLTPVTTYYVAIKVGDEVPNYSTISNVVTFTTPVADLVCELFMSFR